MLVGCSGGPRTLCVAGAPACERFCNAPHGRCARFRRGVFGGPVLSTFTDGLAVPVTPTAVVAMVDEARRHGLSTRQFVRAMGRWGSFDCDD